MGLRMAGRLLWGGVALLQLPLLVRPQPQRGGDGVVAVSVVAEGVVVALNASQAGSRAYFPASVWVTAKSPIELCRSRPYEELLDPVFVETGAGQLLVAASTSPARGASRVFAAFDNASKWTELDEPSLATLNHSLGICLPPSATGTVCLSSDAVELPTPAVHCSPKAHPPEVCPGGVACPACSQATCPCPPQAGRDGVLRSVVLVSDGKGGVAAQPHAALSIDMANASYNMSFESVVNSTRVRSTFRPQAVVADGTDLIMLLIGQFELPPPPPPPPAGCRPAPKKAKPAPATSLVTLASSDSGLSWQYRGSVALEPPTRTEVQSGSKEEPVCAPVCAKGDVCASSVPRTCVAATCKPCKACEVCDRGVCVPGEVRYVTAYPPALVGEGDINGTAGHELFRPQLHALVDQLPLNSSSKVQPNMTLMVSARTGKDKNLTRSFVSADSNGEQWNSVTWNPWNLSSNVSELPAAEDPATDYLVCFSWANGTTVCADRRLQRNVSLDAKGASAAQALHRERAGFLRAGSFQLVPSVRHGITGVTIVGALNVSVDMSAANNNMTAGHAIAPVLPGHRDVQFFSAELHGTPAAADSNGTLIQLLTVSWDLGLSTCLRAQNKLCRAKWQEELTYGPKMVGACSRCLADHMTELVAAGCNDTDAVAFCSTPGLPAPGDNHVVAVVSTDDGRHWRFRARIPPFVGFNATAPNSGLSFGMAIGDEFAPWTCSLNPIAADVTAVDVGPGVPPLLFAVWQSNANAYLPNGAMCGARSRDGGVSWETTNQLHIRRTAAADGSNQNAPPHADGAPPRLSSLGALGGAAMTDGMCGQGHNADGKPGAGLWLWTASALGLNSSHNATPSLEGTNIALMHNAGLHLSKGDGHTDFIERSSFTWDFVNGTSDAAQSSGETDIYLLRSNKTHAEVLVGE